MFESEVVLARPRDVVFAYFADAANLQELTPPWLHFRVLTPMPVAMSVGQLLEYRVRVRGVAMRWNSLISVWDPPRRFVDVQLKGPYRTWIHEHGFEERDGGTVCRDRVRYSVPGGWLVNRLLVRPDIERIFRYRTKKLRELFA